MYRDALPMTAYNLALWAGATAALPVGLPVMLLHEKRRRTVPYRLGLKTPTSASRRAGLRPDGPKLIWVHALSVGETMSAETLMAALIERYGRRRLFFSVSTQSGYATAQRLFTDRVGGIGYFPYDLAPCVAAISRRVDPAMVVVVESVIRRDLYYHRTGPHLEGVDYLPHYFHHQRLHPTNWQMD